MRSSMVLLALCGCNRILGLGDVVERPPVDAKQFDMMPDAAPMCPTGMAPHYRTALHQVQMTTECLYTSIAETGDAMAMCPTQPFYGNVTDGLTPLVFEPSTTLIIESVRIAPEGDFAIAFATDLQVGASSLQALRRNTPATSWRIEGALNIVPLYSNVVSNVSRLVQGQRQLLYFDNSDGLIHTYSGDGEVWAPTGIKFPTGLSTPTLPMSLTPDALHFVVAGVGVGGIDRGTFFYERADVSQPFGTPLFVPTVPKQGNDPFMTNDCGRMYFDALDSLLFVDQ